MKKLSSLVACTATVIGIGLISPPAASAGCLGTWTPWGGGQRCDDPIDANGFFQRCDTGGAFGFNTPPQCYQVDSNNLGNNQPWIGP
ncbi:hypothetical protein FHT40_000841 [Mycolicibacterium sp. BK556]|uniref:hypothetical protein n=1 Tax=Mycobacteriaceae TaxID=1762 RepID=UPI00105F4C46|nr:MULTISPECIES: hypothetical protein [Mycobacteriaceae]MBB3601208.1 hypothetical protein [Mycolicibacterium sp. BK556]MBB3630960.1 hypothetical protein [Mycolicibacterium sp. BK607]MBB3748962.1 hypothetical protein [Mycolicibacterium sp. BK634]TDO14827.1 hypothetical protein EV580_2965 [Mycobacterium sp. BK086]